MYSIYSCSTLPVLLQIIKKSLFDNGGKILPEYRLLYVKSWEIVCMQNANKHLKLLRENLGRYLFGLL